MISKAEAKRWIDTIPDDSGIAIDEGGLCLVEIDAHGVETGACLEVGGIPEEDDGEDARTEDASSSS